MKSRIDESRCQWLGTREKLKSRKNDTVASVSQFNNSWYNGDSGEHADTIKRGKIADDSPIRKPAWERQDKYTKSRNPVNDSKRYTYVDDCTDEIRRDVSLRFAVPPNLPQRERGAVLPELKSHRPTVNINGGPLVSGGTVTQYTVVGGRDVVAPQQRFMLSSYGGNQSTTSSSFSSPR